MNAYTHPNMFKEDAIDIYNKSSIVDKEFCCIYDGVLYEMIGEPDHKYRFFFSVDNYDYLENDRLEDILDHIFNRIQFVGNMKTATDTLVGAAKNWWKSHRPTGWTVGRHLQDPFVNNGTGEEGKQLLGAIAKVVAEEMKLKMRPPIFGVVKPPTNPMREPIYTEETKNKRQYICGRRQR